MFPLALLNASSSPSPPVVYGTVLWLKFEGTNGSNSFVDESPLANIMTTVGTPTIQNNQGVFDGGGYIYTDTLPAFLDNDFLITGKFSIPNYPPRYYYQYNIFGFYRGVEILDPICLAIGDASTSNYKKLYVNAITTDLGQLFLTHQTDVSLNDEHTFKVERSNGVIRLFLDDIEATSTIVTSKSLSVAESRFCVGYGADYGDEFVGTIDNVVVVKQS